MDFWPTVYVFVLASFIGLGVIRRVSRLLHTPLMSLTNAISAIAVVGAILVTGYFGGAIATHVRLGDPSFIGAAVLGVLGWLGLYLREPRLRALIPLRN